MQKYWGSFDIKYKNKLENLAEFLKGKVFSGVDFVETDIYDEVPAVMSTKKILGFTIIISEGVDVNWYILEIKGAKHCSDTEKDDNTLIAERMLSLYIKELLENIGLEVLFTREHK